MARRIEPRDLARCVTVRVGEHLALVRVGVDVEQLTPAELAELQRGVAELVQAMEQRGAHRE